VSELPTIPESGLVAEWELSSNHAATGSHRRPGGALQRDRAELGV